MFAISTSWMTYSIKYRHWSEPWDIIFKSTDLWKHRFSLEYGPEQVHISISSWLLLGHFLPHITCTGGKGHLYVRCTTTTHQRALQTSEFMLVTALPSALGTLWAYRLGRARPGRAPENVSGVVTLTITLQTPRAWPHIYELRKLLFRAFYF